MLLASIRTVGVIPVVGAGYWGSLQRPRLTHLAQHFRSPRNAVRETHSYNLVQRITYLVVIFGLFPLVIWTGLAMSPAFVSALPATATALGGRQSARTIHFIVSLILVAFLAVHVAMIWFAGFGARVMPMITGAPPPTRGQE